MTIDEIHAEWERDSAIDFSQPDKMIRDVPLLHAKYWRFFTDERRKLILFKQDHDALRHAKFEYYAGRLDEAERIKRGWPVQPLRLVKTEIDNYINADPDILPLASKVEVQDLKLKFLEDCIKSTNNRNFLIRSYIDWLRFSQGA